MAHSCQQQQRIAAIEEQLIGKETLHLQHTHTHALPLVSHSCGTLSRGVMRLSLRCSCFETYTAHTLSLLWRYMRLDLRGSSLDIHTSHAFVWRIASALRCSWLFGIYTAHTRSLSRLFGVPYRSETTLQLLRYPHITPTLPLWRYASETTLQLLRYPHITHTLPLVALCV